MPKFRIRYGLSGGFGGCANNDWEEIEADNIDQAQTYAWHAACEEYQSYEGLHGLRDTTHIMEEEEVDEEEAEQIYQDERESWLDYEAEPVP